jgi:putative Mn2+ efflux pump MntP
MTPGGADTLEVLLAGAVIGVDNLAAALALGAFGQRKQVWRIAPAFAAFGAGVPLVGAFLGREVSEWAAGLGETVGLVVLAGLGVWMIVHALRGGEEGKEAARRVASGRGILLLAATLSVDNLAVGFGMGMRGADPWALAAAAGVSALVLTLIGLRVGDAARSRWAGVGAGALLVLLAGAIALGWV